MDRRRFLAATGALALAAQTHGIAEPLPHANITLGDERFLRDEWRTLNGRTVGVITNQTGVTSSMQSIVDAIRSNPAIPLKAIYAPEHGFRGDRSAGSFVSSYTDEQTGLPVYSLYGPNRHPSAAMLEGVDILLYDIQDVGSRAYTFISTMAYTMQSAAAHDKEIWILDRPNPVGGTVIEGPVLDPEFSSFIGLYAIAMRHGMTVGELAKLFNEHFSIGAKLHVVPMEQYTREMIWPDTGLQWVQSSPNIPEWQTTFVYLCTGLVDDAGINNGVGFTKPFFYAGGPEVNASALAKHLNARDLPGVYFRPAAWSPTSGFWAGKELSGVELVVFDPRTFRAIRTAVELLVAIRDQAPHLITVNDAVVARTFASNPTRTQLSDRNLDIDWGTNQLRTALVKGHSADGILAQWQDKTAAFTTLREKYLIYQ